jgi:hypothetical protein
VLDQIAGSVKNGLTVQDGSHLVETETYDQMKKLPKHLPLSSYPVLVDNIPSAQSGV